MPLVRINLDAEVANTDQKFGYKVGEIVHKAMVDLINVPADDKFQVITADSFNMTKSYLGIDYSGRLVVIQITLNAGRTVDMKKALYKRIADDLHEQLGHRREDVLINLVEVTRENWSFGNGEMQYAPLPG